MKALTLNTVSGGSHTCIRMYTYSIFGRIVSWTEALIAATFEIFSFQFCFLKSKRPLNNLAYNFSQLWRVFGLHGWVWWCIWSSCKLLCLILCRNQSWKSANVIGEMTHLSISCATILVSSSDRSMFDGISLWAIGAVFRLAEQDLQLKHIVL